MKTTNVHETHDAGLKERIIKRAGDWLVEMAVDLRDCRLFILYEANLTPEMISELARDKPINLQN